MSVRPVYIVWTESAGDRRQQADRVVPVGDLIVIPPKQTTLVPVTSEARTAIAGAAGRFPTSIKAYLLVARKPLRRRVVGWLTAHPLTRLRDAAVFLSKQSSALDVSQPYM